MPASLVIILANHAFNTVRSCSSLYSLNDVLYCGWLVHCFLTWQRCSSNIRDNWYGEKFTSTMRCKHVVEFSVQLQLCYYQVWPSLDLLERQFAWSCDPSSTKLCSLCWYNTLVSQFTWSDAINHHTNQYIFGCFDSVDVCGCGKCNHYESSDGHMCIYACLREYK